MSELRLTSKQAYVAMLSFLNKMHGEFGWRELGALLGSMALIDGVPLDPVFVGDWKGSIQAALNVMDEDARSSCTLTSEQSYAAMSYFLDQMFFNAKRETLKSLIEDMTLVNGMPNNQSLMDYWGEAVKFAEDGGRAASLTVTKDDITYEVHSGLPKPEER